MTGTNCKGIPTAVKRGRKEPVGTVHAFRSDDGSGDILVLTWTDKRKIVILSTKHKVGMVLVKMRYKSYMHKCYKYIHACTYGHTQSPKYPRLVLSHSRTHTHLHTHNTNL